jgi:hypothetical protein
MDATFRPRCFRLEYACPEAVGRDRPVVAGRYRLEQVDCNPSNEGHRAESGQHRDGDENKQG